jgi:GT2 family glycosyltransferase
VYVPDVAIVHEKAAASRAASSRTIRVYYRSIRAFFAKHHAPGMPAPLRALWSAGSYLKEASALAANALRREKGVRY